MDATNSIMNVAFHVFYGSVLGLGFGYSMRHGSPYLYGAYAGLIGLAVAAVAVMVVPKVTARQRSRRRHRHHPHRPRPATAQL